MLRLGVPILLAGLGGLYAERAGIVNIGLEGMMIARHVVRGVGRHRVGPVGRPAVRHPRRRARRPAARARHRHVRRRPHHLRCRDQHPRPRRHALPGVEASLTATESAVGGGSISTSPSVSGEAVHVTSRSSPAATSSAGSRPTCSAGSRTRTGSSSPTSPASLRGLTVEILSCSRSSPSLLVPISACVLWRTPFGLRLRSTGEKPSAADSLGVRVYRFQYHRAASPPVAAPASAAAFLVHRDSPATTRRARPPVAASSASPR